MDFYRLRLLCEDNDNKDKMKVAYDAAMTQRGVPEEVMLEVVHDFYNKVPCPQIIKWGLEHYGDLSHRAQACKESIINFKEKIEGGFSRSIRGGKYVWTAKEEIENNLMGSVCYEIYNNMDDKGEYNREKRLYIENEMRDEVEVVMKRSVGFIVGRLGDYIKAHEEYNRPVTLLGRMGKEFAIVFAKYCIDVLEKGDGEEFYLLKMRNLIRKMDEWLDEYYSLEWEDREGKFLEGFEVHIDYLSYQ